jgi:hypothetical protein
VDFEFRDAKWKLGCNLAAFALFAVILLCSDGPNRLVPAICTLVLALVSLVNALRVMRIARLQITPPTGVGMSTAEAYAYLDGATADARRRAERGPRRRLQNWRRIVDPAYPKWRRLTIAVSSVALGLVYAAWILIPRTAIGDPRWKTGPWFSVAFGIATAVLYGVIYFSGERWDKRRLQDSGELQSGPVFGPERFPVCGLVSAEIERRARERLGPPEGIVRENERA